MVAEGGYDEVTAQKKWSEIGRTVSDGGWSEVIMNNLAAQVSDAEHSCIIEISLRESSLSI